IRVVVPESATPCGEPTKDQTCLSSPDFALNDTVSIMTMSLEQLRSFVTVAEELHFGRAAARLRMPQPPLSRQIQKLERAVGVRLLDRDNRGVRLTAAGEAFLPNVRHLLALAELAPDAARRVWEGGTSGSRLHGNSSAGLVGDTLERVRRTTARCRDGVVRACVGGAGSAAPRGSTRSCSHAVHPGGRGVCVASYSRGEVDCGHPGVAPFSV